MTRPEETILTLRDRLRDALEGYEQARGDVTDAGLRRLFERAAVEHAAAIESVRPLLPAEAGAEEGGTVIGPVTKAIVFLRSAITGDESLLPGMIDGQRRVLEAVDEASAAAGAEVGATLRDVRARLGAVLAELEAARAAAA